MNGENEHGVEYHQWVQGFSFPDRLLDQALKHMLVPHMLRKLAHMAHLLYCDLKFGNFSAESYSIHE